jgi:hypothetical protein
MPTPIDSKSWYKGAAEHSPEHLTETHMSDIFFFTCYRQKGIHPQAPGRNDYPLFVHIACLQGLQLPSRRDSLMSTRA